MTRATSNSADGALNLFGKTALETKSGRRVDLAHPTVEMIDRGDICGALGNQCRFAGHVKKFYSVAEHSVLVANLLAYRAVSVEMQLAGLLHDAAEAYMGDIIAPMKYLEVDSHMRGASLSQFTFTEYRLDQAIAERYGLEARMFSEHEVKLCDLWALRIEAEALTVSCGEGWRWTEKVLALGGLPAGVRWDSGLVPDDATDLMDSRWEQLIQADQRV